MKKIITAVIVFILAVCTLSAGGAKEANDFEPLSAEKAGGYANNLRWIIVDSEGNQTTVEAEDGDSQPDNAIGYIYSTKSGDVTCYTNKETSTLASWIETLANTLDTICFRFILAIHPFPNILFQMYDTSSFETNTGSMSTMSYTMAAGENMQGYSSDRILISNNFYDTSVLKTNRAKNNTEWKVSITESSAAKSSASSWQYSKWSLITVLFVTMFIAEMLFMSIWGYVTGSTENVLKEIAKKAGIAFLLFVLVSALPFLLESMRYGFFEIAGVFYGSVAEAYSSGAGYLKYFDNPGEVFNLPGAFLRQMKVFFASSGTYETGKVSLGALMGTPKEKKYGFFGDLFMWLFLLIFRFVLFFAILKASLHIAINIIEVYLLLGLTMILAPFTVFEPLKPVGAKCIMSLVTNIIECFVILVIIVCVVPVSVTVCTEMLNNIMEYQNNELVYTEIKIVKKSTGESETQVSDMPEAYCSIYANSDFVLFVVPTSGTETDDAQNFVNLGLVYTKHKQISKGKNKTFTKVMAATGVDYAFDITDGERLSNKTPIYTREGADAYSYNRITFDSNSKTADRLEYLSHDFWFEVETVLSYPKYYDADFDSRSIFVDTLASYYNDDLGLNSYLSKHLSTFGTQYYTTYGNDDSSTLYAPDNFFTPRLYSGMGSSYACLTFLGQLLLCLMGVYIPVFFVQQSTQITNALMSGTAAMESFGNALGNIGSSVARGVKTAVGATVKTAGSIAKFVNHL